MAATLQRGALASACITEKIVRGDGIFFEGMSKRKLIARQGNVRRRAQPWRQEA